MYARLLKIDKNMPESAFIFGPRGTGKTSWLKQHFPECLYFDLLHGETYTEFLSNPSVLGARIPSSYTNWVIIDEIQKVPALLDEVHRLIELRGLRFILTGSSARALRRKGVNWLAGRALTYHMHPLTIQEVSDRFDLVSALSYGMLPRVFATETQSHFLSSYVQTYLREEVQQEALTRNISLFTRFLNVASFSQGEVINYTAVAREVGTSRQTIATFFEILNDLLIATQIPAFNRRSKRELVLKNKFYYFDVGVYQTLRPKGPLDIESELSGAGLETLFLQHVRALNDYHKWRYDICYWQTRDQHEVDFILYGEYGLSAFEIKHKQRLVAKDFKGIKLFQDDYPEAKCYVLYGGLRRYFENDIEVIPFQEALLALGDLLA